MINALSRVEVSRYVLHHPAVPPDLTGFSIAQISDVHMGPWVKPHHVRDLVSYVDAQSPHLIALTGDYVGYAKRDIERCAEALSTTTSPCFAVLGNHDHWTDSARSVAAYQASPTITLLTNERVRFSAPGMPPIEVVGVDDLVTKNADAPKAFAEVDPELFCLALNHVPSYAPECASRGAHLILSGHTHNFQFNIPRLTNRVASRLGAQYFSGTYRLDDAILYINRGLGSATWPLRIRSQPELTFFSLAHAAQPSLELLGSEDRAFGA
jgi:hypothetical protein